MRGKQREKKGEKMTDTDYLTTPLTDREAGRVKTLLLKRKGKAIVLRELIMFTPEEIAREHGLNAAEVARFAGRTIEAKMKGQ